MNFLTLWLRALHTIRALRAQLEWYETQWLRAEADADYWYFEANNPEEARLRRAEISSTASIDARAARAETAREWAALDAAGK